MQGTSLFSDSLMESSKPSRYGQLFTSNIFLFSLLNSVHHIPQNEVLESLLEQKYRTHHQQIDNNNH